MIEATRPAHWTDDPTRYDVECDNCGTVESYDVDDWSELMEAMKADGWLVKPKESQVAGEQTFVHICQECRGQ